MADIKSIKINGNLIVENNVTLNGIKGSSDKFVKIGSDGILKAVDSVITSINGLAGGMLTSPLQVGGGRGHSF